MTSEWSLNSIISSWPRMQLLRMTWHDIGNASLVVFSRQGPTDAGQAYEQRRPHHARHRPRDRAGVGEWD